jgi:NAD(P)-dependent dehydrogenase (short-subunit alcohol dehydrogenase family)
MAVVRPATGFGLPVAGATAAAVVVRSGTYVVTGGLGGLGMMFSRWLVQRGAGCVVLVGRKEPSAAVRDVAEQLARDTGAKTAFARADVADAGALRAALDNCDCGCSGSEAPRFCGVLHAAGVSYPLPLPRQAVEAFEYTFGPKVRGAWNLHELDVQAEAAAMAQQQEQQQPRLFVMFSSIAGLLGVFGQANYAAANAFMDGLARMRARTCPGSVTVSVRWGPFGNVGMLTQASDAVTVSLRQNGFRLLDADEGIRTLECVLSAAAEKLLTSMQVAEPCVVAVDWERFISKLARPQPMLSRLLGDAKAKVATTAAAAADVGAATDSRPSALKRAIAHRGEAEALAAVVAEVRAAVRDTIGDGAAEEADRPLVDAGMDSLLAVELRNALQRRIGGLGTGAGVGVGALPATLAYDHPSITAIAQFLLGLLAVSSPSDFDVAATAAAPTAEQQQQPQPQPLSGDWQQHAMAVIGVGCRLPSAASADASAAVGSGGVDEYWRLLCAGACAVSEIPKARFDVSGLYEPADVAAAAGMGGMYVRRAALVAGIDMFDAAFFGIVPSEASMMDPQQRLLLEVVWEALERAGIALVTGTDALRQRQQRKSGSDRSVHGVYVGCGAPEYGMLAAALSNDGPKSPLSTSSPYAVTGAAQSAIAGRISYSLGLTGPAMVVDTACSSSLVAASLAADGL